MVVRVGKEEGVGAKIDLFSGEGEGFETKVWGSGLKLKISGVEWNAQDRLVMEGAPT